MSNPYPRRGKTEDTDRHGDILAAVLWRLGQVLVVLFVLWTWTPVWDMLTPHFSWLP